MSEKICLKCAKKTGFKNFCPECGEKIEYVPRCKWCETEVLPQHKYCEGCGKTSQDALKTSPPLKFPMKLIKFLFTEKPKLAK